VVHVVVKALARLTLIALGYTGRSFGPTMIRICGRTSVDLGSKEAVLRPVYVAGPPRNFQAGALRRRKGRGERGEGGRYLAADAHRGKLRFHPLAAGD
jgi:hypothetical protein